MVNQEPISIKTDIFNLFGIIRKQEHSDKVVIFVPAPTGTRIGPQRIFTETANLLAQNNIASLCIELPGAGDSCYLNNKFIEDDDLKYDSCLRATTMYLMKHYTFKQYFFVTISFGALPIYNFAQANNYKNVIFLSPSMSSEASSSLNKNNLKRYYIKLFMKETWCKIFRLKLNFSKIIGNIVDFKKLLNKVKRKSKGTTISLKNADNCINLYTIYGEKENSIYSSRNFWESKVESLNKFETTIIKGADHNFFGWGFKKDVANRILEIVK